MGKCKIKIPGNLKIQEDKIKNSVNNPKILKAVNTQLVDTLVQIIRSLSATEQALLEKQLFSDVSHPSTLELMHLAEKGGALDFLYDEPDIYTTEDGEPV